MIRFLFKMLKYHEYECEFISGVDPDKDRW